LAASTSKVEELAGLIGSDEAELKLAKLLTPLPSRKHGKMYHLTTRRQFKFSWCDDYDPYGHGSKQWPILYQILFQSYVISEHIKQLKVGRIPGDLGAYYIHKIEANRSMFNVTPDDAADFGLPGLSASFRLSRRRFFFLSLIEEKQLSF